MHWCPQETEAVIAGAGAAGMMALGLRWRWHQIKTWVGYRLLALHLHKCDATCGCWRYEKMVMVAA